MTISHKRFDIIEKYSHISIVHSRKHNNQLKNKNRKIFFKKCNGTPLGFFYISSSSLS